VRRPCTSSACLAVLAWMMDRAVALPRGGCRNRLVRADCSQPPGVKGGEVASVAEVTGGGRSAGVKPTPPVCLGKREGCHGRRGQARRGNSGLHKRIDDAGKRVDDLREDMRERRRELREDARPWREDMNRQFKRQGAWTRRGLGSLAVGVVGTLLKRFAQAASPHASLVAQATHKGRRIPPCR